MLPPSQITDWSITYRPHKFKLTTPSTQSKLSHTDLLQLINRINIRVDSDPLNINFRPHNLRFDESVLEQEAKPTNTLQCASQCLLPN